MSEAIPRPYLQQHFSTTRSKNANTETYKSNIEQDFLELLLMRKI